MAQRIAVEPAGLSDEVPIDGFALALFGVTGHLSSFVALRQPRRGDGREATDGGAQEAKECGNVRRVHHIMRTRSWDT
jgi:hypothetical protein